MVSSTKAFSSSPSLGVIITQEGSSIQEADCVHLSLRTGLDSENVPVENNAFPLPLACLPPYWKKTLSAFSFLSVLMSPHPEINKPSRHSTEKDRAV